MDWWKCPLFLLLVSTHVFCDVTPRPYLKSHFNLCPGITMKNPLDAKDIYNQIQEGEFFTNPDHRSYLLALYGVIQEMIFAECKFIVGNLDLDFRIPHSHALSSSMTQISTITGTLKIKMTDHGLFSMTNLMSVLNEDKEKDDISFEIFHDPSRSKPADWIWDFSRYNPGPNAKITNYYINIALAKPITTTETLPANTGEHYGIVTNVGGYNNKDFIMNAHKLQSNGDCKFGGQVMKNGISIENECCPEDKRCANGCYKDKNDDIKCAACIDGYYLTKENTCVACSNSKRLSRFCMESSEGDGCPFPMVTSKDKNQESCGFSCPRGWSLLNDIKKELDPNPRCSECQFFYDDKTKDFTEARTNCLKSCSYFGLLTHFSQLGDKGAECPILLGQMTINSLSFTSATRKPFEAMMDKIFMIYGDLHVYDLFTVYFKLPNLQRIDGTLGFYDMEMLRDISLPSVIPKQVRKLKFERLPKFNMPSREKFYKRLLKNTDDKYYVRTGLGQCKGRNADQFKHGTASPFPGGIISAPIYTKDICTNPTHFIKYNPSSSKTECVAGHSNTNTCPNVCAGCSDGITTFKCGCQFKQIDEDLIKTCLADECPRSFYLASDNKNCKRCHKNCITCNGDKEDFGPDGCKSCQLFYINEEGKLKCFPYIPNTRGKNVDAVLHKFDNLKPNDEKWTRYPIDEL